VGTVHAATSEEARALISADLIVLEISPARGSWASHPLHLGHQRVRVGDVAWLARQLATTETAGLPIKRALDTIANQKHGTPIGETVRDLCERLAEGQGLPAAFGAHATEFGPAATALIAAGAASGSMAATFTRVADMLDEQVTLRRQVRGALTYPSAVAIMSVALTAAMLVFVVPTFKNIYAQLNGRLPFATRALLALSNVARTDLWIVVVLALLTVALFRKWRVDPAHALRIDRAKVRLPLVGGLVFKAAVARVASTLAGLLDAGVTTLLALDLAGQAAGLRHVTESVREIKVDVASGNTVAGSFATHGTWPDTMVQLAHLGEETGQLGALLSRYAETSRLEVTAEVDRVVSLIEPLMVVIIGAIVGGTVVCLYLPLFNLVNLIK
jgi:type IV pilus assembly protein PilC